MPYLQSRWVLDSRGVGREVRYELDEALLAQAQSWAGNPVALRREIEAMRAMYPAWILTLAKAGTPRERPGRPGDWAAPIAGHWRWISDLSVVDPAPRPGSTGLAWHGLLAAPLAGLPEARRRLERHFPVQEVEGRPWTTVPLTVAYPDRFPESEPVVHYHPKWLQALALPLGGATHILWGGQLCLFYPGHWKRRFTVSEVLSQRVVNHLYSVLKVAAGVPPRKAFIGRVDNEAWSPGRKGAS